MKGMNGFVKCSLRIVLFLRHALELSKLIINLPVPRYLLKSRYLPNYIKCDYLPMLVPVGIDIISYYFTSFFIFLIPFSVILNVCYVKLLTRLQILSHLSWYLQDSDTDIPQTSFRRNTGYVSFHNRAFLDLQG